MSMWQTNGPENDAEAEDRPTPAPDDTTDPDPEARPRRIPNLGHALAFLAFAVLLLILFERLLAALEKSPVQAAAATIERPKLQIGIEAVAYLGTLLAAWFYYPPLWRRSFLDGIQWRWTAARSQAGRLIALGLLLGSTMYIVIYFVAPSKTPPINDFFLTPADAWLLTGFGTLVAPAFEEICFRGFLVPAFAIAYDWLSLSRTDEARTRWKTTTTFTPLALIFSAILSSLLFALLHGPQVAYMWAAMLVLFSISLVLTFVRVKTQSVASSALVHASYNSFVFLMTLIGTGGYRHLDRMTH